MPLIIEHDIEVYLKSEIEKLGGRCLKFSSTYEEGIPDRIVILNGKTAFVEVKRPSGGRLSEVQKYQHEKLKKSGAMVRVVKNKEEVNELIKELTNGKV